MKKLLFIVLTMLSVMSYAQIDGKPSKFYNGIQLPNAIEDTTATRIPVMGNDGTIIYYIEKDKLGGEGSFDDSEIQDTLAEHNARIEALEAIDPFSKNPSDLNPEGAVAGNVMKFNGTEWAPGNDNTGGGGSAPTAGYAIIVEDTVVNVDTNLVAPRTLVNTKQDTFATKDSYDVKQNYYDSRRIESVYNAQKIRDNAGLPPNVHAGNIVGSTVGMSDSAGAIDEAIVVITSEAQAIAESDSGDGSRNNPYLIRNKLIVNSTSSTANGGFIWNDPDADYYVKLQNCYLGGYQGRNLYMNSPTKLVVENCHLQALNSGVSGYDAAVGVDFDLGTLEVTNSVIGGFGNDFFNGVGADSIILENNLFANYFFTNRRNIIFLQGDIYLRIAHCQTDGIFLVNNFLNLSGSVGIEFSISNNYLRTDAIRYMFNLSLNNESTGAVWHNDLWHDGDRSIIYGNILNNVEIVQNTLYAEGMVEFPLIYVDGSSTNIFARQNKFTSLGDELSEPIFVRRSINGIYRENWITRSNADGYEFFNSYHGNQIIDNVADSIHGQCVDWFTQRVDSANIQHSNVVRNIYGDSYDVPVIITNTRGVTVQNVFCKAHNLISPLPEYDTIPAVLIENRGWGTGSVPSDIHIMGIMPLPNSIPSGQIVKFQSTVGENNTGYWRDTEDRYYGLTPSEIAKLKIY